MAQNGKSDDVGGCAACFGLILVLALVVASVISVAAIVDPFGWMPSVGEVWAECEGSSDECDLAARFPGFWVHVLVNLAWGLVAVFVVVAAFGAAADAREARGARFDDEHASARFRTSRDALLALAALGFLVAALPIAVALL